jgi:hypothetical protein
VGSRLRRPSNRPTSPAVSAAQPDWHLGRPAPWADDQPAVFRRRPAAVVPCRDRRGWPDRRERSAPACAPAGDPVAAHVPQHQGRPVARLGRAAARVGHAAARPRAGPPAARVLAGTHSVRGIQIQPSLQGERPATVMEDHPAPILLIVRRDPVPALFLGVAPLSVGVGAPVARAIRRKPYLAPARMPLPCAVRIERGLEIDCGSRSLRQDRRSGRFDPGDTAQNAKSRCDRQQRTREDASYGVTLRFTRFPPEPRPEEPVPSGRRFAPPADAKT